MWYVSALSLIVVMVLCVAGIFAPKAIYDDNLAQRIGMAGIFCFSWPRLAQLFETHELTARCLPAEAQVAGHVGLALFAIGTAWKVYRKRPKKEHPTWPPLPPISSEHWHQIGGGRKG